MADFEILTTLPINVPLYFYDRNGQFQSVEPDAAFKSAWKRSRDDDEPAIVFETGTANDIEVVTLEVEGVERTFPILKAPDTTSALLLPGLYVADLFQIGSSWHFSYRPSVIKGVTPS